MLRCGSSNRRRASLASWSNRSIAPIWKPRPDPTSPRRSPVASVKTARRRRLPRAASRGQPRARLGDIVVELGFCDRDAVEAAVAAARRRPASCSARCCSSAARSRPTSSRSRWPSGSASSTAASTSITLDSAAAELVSVRRRAPDGRRAGRHRRRRHAGGRDRQPGELPRARGRLDVHRHADQAGRRLRRRISTRCSGASACSTASWSRTTAASEPAPTDGVQLESRRRRADDQARALDHLRRRRPRRLGHPLRARRGRAHRALPHRRRDGRRGAYPAQPGRGGDLAHQDPRGPRHLGEAAAPGRPDRAS